MRANLNALLPWVRVRNIYSTNESGDNAIADSDGRFRVMTDVAFEVLDPLSLIPVPAGVMGALHVRCPWNFKGYYTAEGAGHLVSTNLIFVNQTDYYPLGDS